MSSAKSSPSWQTLSKKFPAATLLCRSAPPRGTWFLPSPYVLTFPSMCVARVSLPLGSNPGSCVTVVDSSPMNLLTVCPEGVDELVSSENATFDMSGKYIAFMKNVSITNDFVYLYWTLKQCITLTQDTNSNSVFVRNSVTSSKPLPMQHE
ncbi:hypothetical protein M758_UG155600 [Ceratodon purpureus]|nr:hypothetical protein M758_UG155600 [Ceratodon purpureus]